MARPRSKSSSPAKPRGKGKRKSSQRSVAPSTRNPTHAFAESEQLAKAAVAHEARAIPLAPDRVKLALTVFLNREDAERLTARAIREGKNLEGLVAEILESASEVSGSDDTPI